MHHQLTFMSLLVLFLHFAVVTLNLREKKGFIQSHTVEEPGFEETSVRFPAACTLHKGKWSLRERVGQAWPHKWERWTSRRTLTGLPWWRSGWESACQCSGHGFEPWSGKIPHAAEQLGPWATTIEPARLEPVLRNKRGRDSERPAHRDEEWPPLAATRESPRTETKTQHSQKLIN